MPKLDNHGRILIPSNLRKSLRWETDTIIAVCYDFSNHSIILCPKANITNEYVISFRELDPKGRFSLSKEAIAVLNASKEDFLVVAVQGNRIVIKKP